jgi:hypothetical protein
MTKFNWNIEPIPGFSCVQMKLDIQAKIYEETKGMTLEERRERTRQASERFWDEIRQRKDQMKGGEEK